MYCRRCRHPLQGLTSHSCPECGRAFDPGDAASFLRDPQPNALFNVLIGASLIAAMLVWVGLAWGQPLIFLDVPSLIWIIVFVTGGLWMSAGPAASIDAIVKGIAAHRERSPHRLARRLEILTRGYQLSWAAGIIGMMVGVVTMVKNLADPAAIGPGMAVSLLVAIYGAILAELGFASLRAILIGRADIDPAERASLAAWSPPSLGFGAAAVFMLIAVFFILAIGMIGR